jgi:hypothetical protein
VVSKLKIVGFADPVEKFIVPNMSVRPHFELFNKLVYKV